MLSTEMTTLAASHGMVTIADIGRSEISGLRSLSSQTNHGS